MSRLSGKQHGARWALTLPTRCSRNSLSFPFRLQAARLAALGLERKTPASLAGEPASMRNPSHVAARGLNSLMLRGSVPFDQI